MLDVETPSNETDGQGAEGLPAAASSAVPAAGAKPELDAQLVADLNASDVAPAMTEPSVEQPAVAAALDATPPAADNLDTDAALDAVTGAAIIVVAKASPKSMPHETKTADDDAPVQDDKAAVAAPAEIAVVAEPVVAAVPAVAAPTAGGSAPAAASDVAPAAVASQPSIPAAAGADAQPTAPAKTDAATAGIALPEQLPVTPDGKPAITEAATPKVEKLKAEPGQPAGASAVQTTDRPASQATPDQAGQPADPKAAQQAAQPGAKAAPAAPPDAARPHAAPHDTRKSADSTSTLKVSPDQPQAFTLPQTAAAAAPDRAAAAAPAAPQAAAIPIAGIAVEIASKALEGKNRFEIRLDPPELGRIHVRLDVDRNGEIVSHVMTDRQDTLDLMRRDASALERALQDAGLKTANNGLQFSLRDHGFGRHHAPLPIADHAQLVVSDEHLAAETIVPVYRGLPGKRAGIDIRV
jgi:flagellar hook-length control protein FliK